MTIPEDLQARSARWGLALAEVCAATRELRSLIRELGLSDPENDLLAHLISTVAERAEPPAVVIAPDDPDDDDDSQPDPSPAPLPVTITP